MQYYGALLLVTNPKIGTTYIVKKEYQSSKQHCVTFIGRLTKIERNNSITYLGARIHNFYFEDITQLYEYKVPRYNIDYLQGPYTVYEPDNRHPGILFSAKFFRRLPMLSDLTQDIHRYHLRKILVEFERKTGIPEAVLTNVLIRFI
jgi:hypothetical protein